MVLLIRQDPRGYIRIAEKNRFFGSICFEWKRTASTVSGRTHRRAGWHGIRWHVLYVDMRERAVELIDWYRARWEIEIYFHVLKNGCEVESLQLGAIDRIERALALFMVVAWRVTH